MENKAKLTMADLTTKELPTWCGACVIPGEIINTNPSIKRIESVQIGDQVLGSDGRYHLVSDVMAHEHKGKIFRIFAKCFGAVSITGEHPVYISRRQKRSFNNKNFPLEWVKAEELRNGDYLAYPIISETKDLEIIELPLEKKPMDRKSSEISKKVKLDKRILRLFGYYIAEGYFSSRKLAFVFSSKEETYAKDVKNIFQKFFGLDAHIRKGKRNTIYVDVYHSPLGRVFNKWFGHGAQNKKLPHFLMLLQKDKQKELLKGLWRGDGYFSPKKAGYKTISPILTEQIKHLLLRQGIVPSISTNKAYGIHKTSYSIEIVSLRDLKNLKRILGIKTKIAEKGKRKPPIIIDNKFVYLPIRKIELLPYHGVVYNLEVEDVNCYVMKNSILHNCGDFNILFTLKNALVELNIPQHDVLLVSGIGCGSKTPHFIRTYGFEGLHGRALPVATGAKLANNALTVIAVMGDGDGYGIGGNHLLHIMRRNFDMTAIVQNNAVYGLTKGQMSPTSQKGFKTPSTPSGSIETPINPMAWGIIGGATYVARGNAYDVKHLQKLLVEGVKHKGFALIDIFQPCSTYNKINTIQWYKENTYKLEETGHDPADRAQALTKAEEWEPKVPIGLFYKAELPTYEDSLPQIAEKPLVRHDIHNVDISKALEKFK